MQKQNSSFFSTGFAKKQKVQRSNFSTGFAKKQKVQRSNFSAGFGFNKSQKARGQAAIEFIFIILIVVVYIFTATLPLIENAKGSIEDIDNITKINTESQRIVNSVNKISLLGIGSKETITIIIPSHSKINCATNEISFETKINNTGNNPPTTYCEENICTKTFSMLDGFNLNCQIPNITKGIYSLKIEKQESDLINIGLSD